MKEASSISVSLIVATCNRSNLLQELLESLSRIDILSRDDIEVVIVDNGSHDDSTYQCCRNYRVLYLHQDKAGLSSALNLGIDHSTGKYIAFTDDDVVTVDNSWLDKLQRNFTDNPQLGYVSGNVLAVEIGSEAQAIWEKKGGLSKGQERKIFTKEYLLSFDPSWRISQVAAGANSMIPRKVINEIGGFSTFLGGGAPIGHGNTLEIVYRVIKAGYDLAYEPEAVVRHHHPETSWELRRKLYTYGIGDVCYQLYIFAEHGDWRYLYGATFRHFNLILGSILMGFLGKYPMPASYRIFSLFGSLVGFPKFLVNYFFWRTNRE